MVSLLLAVIYMAFISLGLPDSLLGAAWPVMHLELGASLASVGLVTILISAGTILSSLLSDRLTQRFGTGLVTAVSVFLTAAALWGYSASHSFWQLCLWALPYGFGAGAIDAALNNYVALHYAARHMSWLHCFWGIGTSISPYIMSWHLRDMNWNGGFQSAAMLQMVFTALLFLSLPLWKKEQARSADEIPAPEALGPRKTLKLPGVVFAAGSLFVYCALESTAGLWASSYLVQQHMVDPQRAARFASLFYLGITGGRFLCGFVSDKLGDRNMVRLGIAVLSAGILFILLPTAAELPALAGLVIAGFGCAPVYPSLIHAAPENFGKAHSQSVIGVQMAFAFLGSSLAPPVFGLIAQHIHMGLYPLYLLIFAVLLLFFSEKLNRLTTI